MTPPVDSKGAGKPYCEAQSGGMECGLPVDKWGQQCEYHDPEGLTRPQKGQQMSDSKGAAIDEIKKGFVGYIEVTDDSQTHYSYPIKLNEVQAELVADAFNEAIDAILALLAQEVKRVIGKDEPAFLYGSKEQLTMDEGDRFENDLAMARNALRAEQRKAGLV